MTRKPRGPSALVAFAAFAVSCGNGAGTHGTGDPGSSQADSIPASWKVSSWFIDPANSTGAASDTNTCKTAKVPCLTYGGLAATWGTTSPRLRQNTTITFLSSHSDDTDPVYLSPYIENGAVVSVQGVLGKAQQVASGTLSFVVPKNRSAGRLLQAELPDGAAVGELVVNQTRASRAWVYKSAGGNSWSLSQPLAAAAVSASSASPLPSEVNTWADGDVVYLYSPVAIDLAGVAPVAGAGSATPLVLYQLTVLDPHGVGAGDVLSIDNPDVVFLETSIQRFAELGATGFSGGPSFANVDFAGGLDAAGINAKAGMAIEAGQIRGVAGHAIHGAALDEDFILGTPTSIYDGTYGAVFVDTSGAFLVQGDDVGFTTAHGAPAIWGPGALDVLAQARLDYPQGAGAAQATFLLKGLFLDLPTAELKTQGGPTNSCAVDDSGVWHCGIALTAANLDAPVTSGGFGGTAVDPGASSISNDTPIGVAPFQSDMLLWLRADRGITFATDGSVTKWADQTGLGGRDAAPLYPGMPGPLYVPNAYGTLPALRGDGTRSLMVNGGHGYTVGKQSTFFIVASPSTAGTSGITYFNESTQGWQYGVYEDSAGVHWLNYTAYGVTNTESFDGGGGSGEDAFLFTPPPAPGLHIFGMSQQDGVQCTGYFDGSQIASIANPVGPSVYVMSVMGGPGDAFTSGVNDPEGIIISSGLFDTNGDVEEVIQYGRALSPAEVAQVNAYLESRWPNSNPPPPPPPPDAGSPDGGSPDSGVVVPEAAVPPPQCVYEAGTAPAGPAVCGDGWRDPATEECDDGLGDAGIRRGCSSTCTVVDELDIAYLGADGGLSNTPRTLGGGRHPVAAGVQTFGVVTLETPSSPPTVILSTFSRKGAATGVVTSISTGSTVSDTGDPVIAALPCDQYAVAWNDVGGDTDGLGVALRLVNPDVTPGGLPSFANTTTAFDQYAPDILWTGSTLIAAWTDTSNATTGPDVRYRTFDSTLHPTSDEQTLAATADVEGDVTLAPFEGSWAAAWRDDANGFETIRVTTGSTSWTVGPGFLPPSVTTKLALVELDASNLLVLYSQGSAASDAGAPNAVSTLMAAVLNLSSPGTVSGVAVPVNTTVEGATAASLSHAYADAVRIGTSIYAAWWTDSVVGNGSGEQVWFQPVGWNGTALSWTGTELSLPRTAAHRAGNQRRPMLAASTLEPDGALVSGWDDLGETFGGGEGNGDVVVELVPVPVLRNGAQ